MRAWTWVSGFERDLLCLQMKSRNNKIQTEMFAILISKARMGTPTPQSRSLPSKLMSRSSEKEDWEGEEGLLCCRQNGTEREEQSDFQCELGDAMSNDRRGGWGKWEQKDFLSTHGRRCRRRRNDVARGRWGTRRGRWQWTQRRRRYRRAPLLRRPGPPSDLRNAVRLSRRKRRLEALHAVPRDTAAGILSIVHGQLRRCSPPLSAFSLQGFLYCGKECRSARKEHKPAPASARISRPGGQPLPCDRGSFPASLFQR